MTVLVAIFLSVFLSGSSGVHAGELGPGLNLPSLTRTSEMAVDAADFRSIAKAGFRHVRQPVLPELLQQDGPGSPMRMDGVDALARRVNLAGEAGLKVVIDLHPRGDYKSNLAKDRRARAEFVAFWRAIARELKGRERNAIFEILNEPGGIDGNLWWKLQYTAMRAIHKEDPERMVIASAAGPSTVPDLVRHVPYRSSRILYAFHYYTPMIFTHQGANWGKRLYENIHGVPWPVSNGDIRRAEKESSVIEMSDEIRSRPAAYNAGTLMSDLRKAASWATKHKVQLYCGEFGVYRKGGVDAGSRLAYLRDARTALDDLGIDWALWQYTGGFGIASASPSGQRSFDPDALAALGRSRE
jgi:aryl-phospho-beta-D-glucosidase BglC (GH1 family)